MSVTDDVVVPATATATATALLFPAALILTTAVLSCLPGAPSAPGCLAAFYEVLFASPVIPYLDVRLCQMGV
ncbi:hypothetical protein [Escherichia coli]|uniref:hypothetical protein n=1 Tax=Escherichia coli TaxID=562 RepID=UPI001124F567|nr:hypothetical protein [Escherichia coli]